MCICLPGSSSSAVVVVWGQWKQGSENPQGRQKYAHIANAINAVICATFWNFTSFKMSVHSVGLSRANHGFS